MFSWFLHRWTLSWPGWWLYSKIVYPRNTVTFFRNNQAVSWPRLEPVTQKSQVQHPNHYTTEPLRCDKVMCLLVVRSSAAKWNTLDDDCCRQRLTTLSTLQSTPRECTSLTEMTLWVSRWHCNTAIIISECWYECWTGSSLFQGSPCP